MGGFLLAVILMFKAGTAVAQQFTNSGIGVRLTTFNEDAGTPNPSTTFYV